AADDGTNLPGVSILEKGTTNGTVTNAQGEYSLNAATDGTLVFSFVGYASQEVPIEGRSSIDVVLQVDVRSLDEIVVVGYGQQERKDITGSVVAISSEDFNKGVIGSPQDLLLGKLAGV